MNKDVSMIHNQRIRATYWIVSIAGILSMNPYFVWDTFLNGILSYTVYFFYFISTVLIFAYLNPKLRITKKDFIVFILFLVLFVFTYFVNASLVSIRTTLGAVLSLATLFAFSTISAEHKKNIFQIFTKLFVITLVPGLIYYILELLGISLSIGTLYSSNQIAYLDAAENIWGNAGYYRLYIGAVLRVNYNMRFSGIYDEAGLVGTVTALLLAGRRFDLKKDPLCRWLLFFNLISFSFAGYLLILIYFVIRWIKQGKWKLCLGVAVFLVVFNIFMNMSFNNELINSIQNRFEITATGISIVNNRETSTFKKGFRVFTDSGILTKLFGFGYGSANHNTYLVGSSTYKFTIFDYGYFGFGLRLLLIFYIIEPKIRKHLLRNWDAAVLIILFYVSIYQRPAVLFLFYFIILYGGISNVMHSE